MTEGKSMGQQRRVEKMREGGHQFVKEGTISHGTLNPDDLIPTLLTYLKDMGKNSIVPLHLWPELGRKAEGIEALRIEPDIDPQEVVEDLFDAIQEFLPEGFYCGAHPGDGSDFGIWKHEDEMDEVVKHFYIVRQQSVQCRRVEATSEEEAVKMAEDDGVWDNYDDHYDKTWAELND